MIGRRADDRQAQGDVDGAVEIDGLDVLSGWLLQTDLEFNLENFGSLRWQI